MTTDCCLNCTKRVVGCHSTCPEYLLVYAKRERERQERAKKTAAESDFYNAMRHAIDRVIKKRKEHTR